MVLSELKEVLGPPAGDCEELYVPKNQFPGLVYCEHEGPYRCTVIENDLKSLKAVVEFKLKS